MQFAQSSQECLKKTDGAKQGAIGSKTRGEVESHSSQGNLKPHGNDWERKPLNDCEQTSTNVTCLELPYFKAVVGNFFC